MYEYEYNQKLMGTEVSVSIVTTSSTLADQVGKYVLSEISKYEDIFSRFKSGSELSKLNQQKSLVASDDFIEVLQSSYHLYKDTKGAFNPLLDISRQGYGQDFSVITQSVQSEKVDSYNIDFDAVVINLSNNQVTLQSDQNLDFGGFLKGYVAEKIARDIVGSHAALQGVIINIGGDLHTRGVDVDGDPFVFSIYNPVLKSEREVALQDKSLATSGTYKRQWQTASGNRHHILDADGLTGPAINIVSASVVHEQGAVAEAFTKVLLINGPEHCPYPYVAITNTGEEITCNL